MKKRKYDNDNGTQQGSKQLKDQNHITDLQRTILQRYNKQGQRKQLKDRNKKFPLKQQSRQQIQEQPQSELFKDKNRNMLQ